MWRDIKNSLLVLIVLTVLTGLAYPLAITGIAQVLFPKQANGSLIIGSTGEVFGSELIGQAFTSPKYFWGRLSATGPTPYNAAASTGSNFGPLHPDLVANAKLRIDALAGSSGHDLNKQVPVDLVTSSGSGLDPHISPAAAEYQVDRVAKARNLDPQSVRTLVQKHTLGRQFGLLGEPRVNILQLNLALDQLNKAN